MIEADRIVSTTCPYCGVGCNLELHIKDDYIYRVTSPFDAVVNHGNLPLPTWWKRSATRKASRSSSNPPGRWCAA